MQLQRVTDRSSLLIAHNELPVLPSIPILVTDNDDIGHILESHWGVEAPKLDLSNGPRWACCGRNRLQNDHESAVCLPPVTSNVVRGWVLTKVPELIGGGPERLAHLLQPKPVPLVHDQGTES